MRKKPQQQQKKFCDFIWEIADMLQSAHRQRTAETYMMAMKRFLRYRKGRDVALDGVTPELIEGFEAHLKGDGLCDNSISFYTRILRAVYNRAVDRGLVEDLRPFKRVYTGVDKTVKRAITPAAIRNIRDLDLDGTPTLRLARDMFMLSFYLRGISFVDLAHLKKSSIRDGVISYRRRKTGKLIRIGIEPEIKELLDIYRTPPDNPLLLCLIRDYRKPHYNQYRTRLYEINRDLKRVGDMAGLTIPLTMYVARHSWASAARDGGVPLSLISQCMGHNSESTTLIYLSDIDTRRLDSANRQVIDILSAT